MEFPRLDVHIYMTFVRALHHIDTSLILYFISMGSKYPSRADIEALFKNMETGNYQELFKSISPSVDWTVMGRARERRH